MELFASFSETIDALGANVGRDVTECVANSTLLFINLIALRTDRFHEI